MWYLHNLKCSIPAFSQEFWALCFSSLCECIFSQKCFPLLPLIFTHPGKFCSLTGLGANRLGSWISSKVLQSVNGKSGIWQDIKGALHSAIPPSLASRFINFQLFRRWTLLIETLIHSWLILTFLIQRNADYLSHSQNIYEEIKFHVETSRNTLYLFPRSISWRRGKVNMIRVVSWF